MTKPPAALARHMLKDGFSTPRGGAVVGDYVANNGLLQKLKEPGKVHQTKTDIHTHETLFSRFIRTAQESEKMKVYTEVMQKATDRQNNKNRRVTP